MKRIRVITLILSFALFFTGIKDVDTASSVQFHFLNVGQGDATLIQTPNENILIDGGSKGKGPKLLGT